MTTFTPSVPVLTPIADESELLGRAESSLEKLAAGRRDRWYPAFHIASQAGWINDPNGLSYFGGRWHVFYQLNPFGVKWDAPHWGHVSSADMLHWRREPVTFAPSLEQEKDGVFSGSAVIDDDGKLRMFYTGHRWANGVDNTGGDWQVQMLAVPDDETLESFTKRGMVIDCPIDRVDHHFRDPKVWKTDGRWYMTFGVSSKEGRGQMWLFTSDDLVSWNYDGVLFEHPDPDVFMLECPDFFPLKDADGNEKWVIGFSAMGAKPNGFMNRNVSNAGYMIGTWQPGERFVPETDFRLWDCGHNFYAPQSFATGKDDPCGEPRQLMYGWMSQFVDPIPSEDDGWSGQLTLPREIRIGAEGDIVTPPAREIEALRNDSFHYGDVELGVNGTMTLSDDAEAVELELTLDLADTTAERAGIRFHCTDDGAYTSLAFDAQMGRIVLDRGAAARGDRGYRTAPLSGAELAAGKIDLRLFIDRGSVEVYVNGGRQVLSSYSYPSDGHRAIRLVAESGTAAFRDIKLHHLASIGLE
ncbi:glycoside hydrolase family 32 protein [Bifidobacterium choloepi]|uniref:beta-fructofuranosidase n=1 Tax=Bifidobacterium choloepi TaxID=2614131 RepID=A0A6I5NI46_9BIFI|nr:GH32 C-terminal domain-containing protein [Bifidobacterium choloepi]NEG70013.1 glycoside hydrolase family 32 protein [Bifidobacterium choloepi]